MSFEERAVLENRMNVKKSFREKEWWYSYLYDEKQQLYFGWFFFRAFPIDHFNFVCFDLKNNKTYEFEQDIKLHTEYEKGKLDLQYHDKNMTVSYLGTEEGKRQFMFKSDKHSISLNLAEGSVPAFTRRDNNFVNHYTLFHLFQQQATGTLEFEGEKFEVNTANTYYDHCSGKVPSNTGWHWLAVNNDQHSLASLVNYGAHAQKYTQFFGEGEWHRLLQDVAFEYNFDNHDDPWHITSPDLELVATPLNRKKKVLKIPKLMPFLLDIVHHEFVVNVNGRVRINHKWVDFKNAHGVMEEHHGKW